MSGLELNLEFLPEEIISVDPSKIAAAIKRSALLVQADATKMVQRGKKSGAIYKKYNPSRTHRASAPGEPPASDTGRLASSLRTNIVQAMRAEVGSALGYAEHLEIGTRTIAARPYLKAAFEKNRGRIAQILTDAMKGSFGSNAP